MEAYDFEVVREPLIRKDSVDTEYDTIFRKDNGLQLGIVSRSYQLVEHKDAVKTVLSSLKDSDFEYIKPTVTLFGIGGARMDCTVRIVSEKFSVKKGDVFDPTVIIQNSYDGFRSLSVNFGLYRYTCSNGAKIFAEKYGTKLAHAFNNIDLDNIRNSLKQNIIQVASIMKGQYKKLKGEDGFPYLEKVVGEKHVARVHKRQALEDLDEYVDVEEDESGFQLTKKKFFTAYLLWNILTTIATHHIEGIWARRKMDVVIARNFFRV